MATLILTAAGSAVGGPLGGAIGALIGQRVDRQVLGAKREGPRLAELKVQTSSYGTEIPQLFGTMRVAGTVIWATDLQETRSTSGGKGQPKQTNYAYQANFAVALSARPVVRIGRIWADGNLMRGAAGDWKVRTGFRLHPGTEDQTVDPLIASAEGALAPAHRGIAYAVFEGLELADYGNRIPSLTFEVVADEGDVASGAVALALAGEVAAADDGLMLGGFAASGGSVRGMLDTLAAASGGWFAQDAGGLALRTGGEAVRAVADLGAGGPREVRSVAGAATVPGLVSVSHYDAARDYQAGLQRARLPGAVSPREERVEVPAVIAAGQAKAVAERVLARAEAERVRRTVAAGLDALDVAPGEMVAIAGEPGAWRVARATLEGMAVTLELLPVMGGEVAVEASGGRVLGQADAPAGTTRLVAFETPALDDAILTAPRLSVAAAGTGTGWRRAALLVSVDAGGSWDEAGDTAGAAVIGTVVVPPAYGSAALLDLRGTVEVELLHPGMVLEPADDQRLDRGANLALVGDELLQFGTAELIAAPGASGRWRLGRLLRGRRGTEWAAGIQGVGDRFVLVEGGRVRDLPLPAGTGRARVLASGVGDPVPAEAAVTLDGASVRPPRVARLRWEAAGAGEAAVRWVRRSRAGWRWSDGADVPLGEEAERYLVTVTRPDGSVAAAEVALSPATVPRPCTVTVAQLGTNGKSRGATIAIPA